MYINDLTAHLKCNVKLFADDTSLFTVVRESNIAANDMNHDLKLISQWAHNWRMSFNPDPQKQAVELLFSRKRNELDHLVIHFSFQINVYQLRLKISTRFGWAVEGDCTLSCFCFFVSSHHHNSHELLFNCQIQSPTAVSIAPRFVELPSEKVNISVTILLRLCTQYDVLLSPSSHLLQGHSIPPSFDLVLS